MLPQPLSNFFPYIRKHSCQATFWFNQYAILNPGMLGKSICAIPTYTQTIKVPRSRFTLTWWCTNKQHHTMSYFLSYSDFSRFLNAQRDSGKPLLQKESLCLSLSFRQELLPMQPYSLLSLPVMPCTASVRSWSALLCLSLSSFSHTLLHNNILNRQKSALQTANKWTAPAWWR